MDLHLLLVKYLLGLIAFILKACGNCSHTWRKTILRRVVVFPSTDLLCHMAAPLGKE